MPENHPLDRDFLSQAAKAASDKLPDGYAFLLLAAPVEQQGDKRMVYASNMKREDALNILKEFLLKCGAAEDWMKHIV